MNDFTEYSVSRVYSFRNSPGVRDAEQEPRVSGHGSPFLLLLRSLDLRITQTFQVNCLRT